MLIILVPLFALILFDSQIGEYLGDPKEFSISVLDRWVTTFDFKSVYVAHSGPWLAGVLNHCLPRHSTSTPSQGLAAASPAAGDAAGSTAGAGAGAGGYPGQQQYQQASLYATADGSSISGGGAMNGHTGAHVAVNTALAQAASPGTGAGSATGAGAGNPRPYLRIDDALRAFLEGFMLPRESQQINRVIEAFSKGYFAYRSVLCRERCIACCLGCRSYRVFWSFHCSPGPLANADAAYVLAYSVIMLNTVSQCL